MSIIFDKNPLKPILEILIQSHGQYIESPFKGGKVMAGGCQSHAMSYDVMGGHGLL